MTKKEQIVTIPNILSLFRIILIPVFVIVYFNVDGNFSLWPAMILILSGLTDLVDGFIARHFNQISDLGKILDPVADKLTQVTVICCLSIKIVPLRYLFVIYLLKELAMIIGGAITLKSGIKIPSAKWYGKLSTFELYFSMFLLLIFPNISDTFVYIVVVVSAVLALFAFVMYVRQFFDLRKNNKEKNKKEVN